MDPTIESSSPLSKHEATAVRIKLPVTGRNLSADPRLKVADDLSASIGLYKYLILIL